MQSCSLDVVNNDYKLTAKNVPNDDYLELVNKVSKMLI